jgi:RNase P/RNase MRP subunit POP5
MKALPKSLRSVHRYVAITHTCATKTDLANLVEKYITHLVGIRGLALANPLVKEFNATHAIIQTTTQGLAFVQAALALACTKGHNTQSIKASGMISHLESLCKTSQTTK